MIFNKITERLGLAWIIGLGGAVAAIVFLAWLAGEVIEGDTRHFDDWAATNLHNHASPILTSLMTGITLLGATRVLIGLGAIVLAAFLFAHWRREALLFLITMGGAALVNRVLKLSFQRQRPQPYFDIVSPGSYSFPSGHALLSFCFYGAIAIIVAAHLKRHSQRMIVWTVGASWYYFRNFAHLPWRALRERRDCGLHCGVHLAGGDQFCSARQTHLEPQNCDFILIAN